MMTMPDRLVAIEAGRVVQTGTPDEVHAHPASRSIAELTGALGTLDVRVETGGNGYWLTAPSCRVRAWSPALARHVGKQATLGVRPRAVRVVEGATISMSVGPRTYEANTPTRELRSPAGQVTTVDHELTEGSDVTIALSSWHLFDTSGGLICTGH
jgi:ABC-type Fe3+/spermidine/putrescine transport system ATPase subunit